MKIELQLIGVVAAALVVALLVALVTTPVIKNLAFRVGAVDVPKDGRRMHDHPIPRMGGAGHFPGLSFVRAFVCRSDHPAAGHAAGRGGDRGAGHF